LPVGLPSAAKSRELIEAAPIRMIALVERAVVPFADQSGDIARMPQKIRDGPLAQRQPIEAASFQGIDHPGPMRIAAGQQRRTRRSANWRRGVVLRQAEAFADEIVEDWRLRGAIVEAAEIAVAHIVSHDQYNVRSISHPHSIRATTSSVEHRSCSVI